MSAAEIDAWLAGVADPEQRAALERLRSVIRAAAPDAEEAISYAVPAFKYRGRPLVSYAAAKDHCSFFVMSGTALEPFAAALAGFSTAKGTVRFQPDAPIPDDLVTRLVKARMSEIDAAAAAKGGAKRSA